MIESFFIARFTSDKSSKRFFSFFLKSLFFLQYHNIVDSDFRGLGWNNIVKQKIYGWKSGKSLRDEYYKFIWWNEQDQRIRLFC